MANNFRRHELGLTFIWFGMQVVELSGTYNKHNNIFYFSKIVWTKLSKCHNNNSSRNTVEIDIGMCVAVNITHCDY